MGKKSSKTKHNQLLGSFSLIFVSKNMFQKRKNRFIAKMRFKRVWHVFLSLNQYTIVSWTGANHDKNHVIQ